MSSPKLFLVQEEGDEKDTSRFKTTSLIIEEAAFPRSDRSDHETTAPAQEKEEEEDCEKQNRECTTTTTPAVGDEEISSSVSSSTKFQQNRPSLGQEFEEVADDDDGFATPITSHHKIPVTEQCPPAPKKIRTPNGRHSSTSTSTKRKSPPRRTNRHLRLDLSGEVELMFPPNVRDDLGRKIKKARIED